jgi:hypothetical protein
VDKADSRLLATLASNHTTADLEDIAGGLAPSVQIPSPVRIGVAKDDSLAAVPVKGETEVGRSADVSQEVLCRLPVGLIPFADESREDICRLRQVRAGDS